MRLSCNLPRRAPHYQTHQPNNQTSTQKTPLLLPPTAIESPASGGSVHFFEDGYTSPRQLVHIRLHINQLLLPVAVMLTNVWDFPDATLQSALGCYDGNVYERVMQ